jgi:uncharacterized membrane protein
MAQGVTMAKKPASEYQPLTLKELRKNRKPPRNVFKEARAKATKLERLACWITEHVGTMGFFLIILIWTVLWLSWNFLAPKNLQFDPPMAFVFWLFLSNLIQILLMPLIMVGQNIQGQHAEARAEYDLDVNVKAEEEIETILYHLEYQNNLLIAMMEKMGVSAEEALKKVNHKKG